MSAVSNLVSGAASFSPPLLLAFLLMYLHTRWGAGSKEGWPFKGGAMGLEELVGRANQNSNLNLLGLKLREYVGAPLLRSTLAASAATNLASGSASLSPPAPPSSPTPSVSSHAWGGGGLERWLAVQRRSCGAGRVEEGSAKQNSNPNLLRLQIGKCAGATPLFDPHWQFQP